MALYLVDTSSVIDISKQREPATSTVRGLVTAGHDIGITDIVVAEFFAGISPANRQQWGQFLQTYDYWDTSFEAAARAGQYRYTFARQGIILSTQDTLIAAVAAEVGATLVTRNARDFPMSDITVLVP